MPSKKKKYNARFPPARIKKIMQKDEEVGKVASTVPVMISRLLELFTESLIMKTNNLTASVNARTLTTSHLKQVILSEKKFDFLKELVAQVPDVQANEEDADSSSEQSTSKPRTRGRPRKKRSESDDSPTPRKRGRKRKNSRTLLDEKTAEAENNSDDSEIEDAENEEVDSDSEGDTANERTMEESSQNSRKQGTSSATATLGTVSSCGSERKNVVDVEKSSPIPFDYRQTTTTTDCTLPAPCQATMPGVAGSWSTSPDRTNTDHCAPLNLKMAAGFEPSNQIAALRFGREAGWLPVPQQIGTGMDLLGNATTTAHRIGSPRNNMEPPPAHQPLHQATMMMMMHRPTLPTTTMTRPSYPSDAAFEYGLCDGHQNAMMTFCAAPRNPLTVPPPFDDVLRGSFARENHATQSPPSSIALTPSSLTSSPAGFAIHRMPAVPSSFFPSALLSRSLSAPHGGGTTTGVKQLYTNSTTDEDYDS